MSKPKTPKTKKPEPFIKLTPGATVLYCGHNASFIADIWETKDAVLIRANGPIQDVLVRPANNPTHHMTDFPEMGFWRADLGVFLVPKDQLTKL